MNATITRRLGSAIWQYMRLYGFARTDLCVFDLKQTKRRVVLLFLWCATVYLHFLSFEFFRTNGCPLLGMRKDGFANLVIRSTDKWRHWWQHTERTGRRHRPLASWHGQEKLRGNKNRDHTLITDLCHCQKILRLPRCIVWSRSGVPLLPSSERKHDQCAWNKRERREQTSRETSFTLQQLTKMRFLKRFAVVNFKEKSYLRAENVKKSIVQLFLHGFIEHLWKVKHLKGKQWISHCTWMYSVPPPTPPQEKKNQDLHHLLAISQITKPPFLSQLPHQVVNVWQKISWSRYLGRHATFASNGANVAWCPN